MDIDETRIVASGTWLYDGSVPSRIIIQQEDVWPAFFDPEDDPNMEDKIISCVSVWYEAVGSHTFNSQGGYYHTVQEAKAYVEKMLHGPVNWDN